MSLSVNQAKVVVQLGGIQTTIPQWKSLVEGVRQVLAGVPGVGPSNAELLAIEADLDKHLLAITEIVNAYTEAGNIG